MITNCENAELFSYENDQHLPERHGILELNGFRNSIQVINSLLSETLLVLGSSRGVSIFHMEVNNIDVSSENRLQIPLSGVHPERGGSVDASDQHSISGIHNVHHFLMCMQYYRSWSLTCWHVIWSFLENWTIESLKL